MTLTLAHSSCSLDLGRLKPQALCRHYSLLLDAPVASAGLALSLRSLHQYHLLSKTSPEGLILAASRCSILLGWAAPDLLPHAGLCPQVCPGPPSCKPTPTTSGPPPNMRDPLRPPLWPYCSLCVAALGTDTGPSIPTGQRARASVQAQPLARPSVQRLSSCFGRQPLP